MKKSDALAAGAGPGLLIDEPIAGGATAIEGLVEVVDPVTDVVNAGASPSQEFGDGAIGRGRLEQLDVRVAER